ncbi:DUF456 domain-containing protein [Cohnella sp. LGH]|uniref:DUF456 family protein n=1 Tax=Cohnella phaseoli TaxID=456490 RepID=A0A3D9JPU2_9BACL|nr:MULTISPECIES: DUF456 domain-containing protein [Cohnella]QTH39970.1 DUF456 domain-containing protein [Cohnella sp. LGH]RED75456.1 hypothetical protein DFP98_11571 [Cohnella phaseoli]
MDILGWVLIVALFAVGMAGAIYPILPGALAIYAAFFVYGWFFSFEPFGWWFWIIQTLIVVVLFVADYMVNAWGVKKFGGSRASVIGSTIGILVGPFVIPAFGLIIGPLAGAILGELIHGSEFNRALKVGWGSLVGLFTSTVVKVLLQGAMIVLFIVWLIFN